MNRAVTSKPRLGYKTNGIGGLLPLKRKRLNELPLLMFIEYY